MLSNKEQYVAKHKCSHCSRSYKRKEHLQRHLACHQPIRPYQCPHCRDSFGRLDVMKRHSENCLINPARSTSKPRSRRRACDRCVQHKVACDSKSPCTPCRRKGALCRPVALQGLATSSKTTNLSESNQACSPSEQYSSDFGSLPPLSWFDEPWSTDWHALFAESQQLKEGQIPAMSPSGIPASLSFLDKFTSNNGFLVSFDCCTEFERLEIAASVANLDNTCAANLDRSQPDKISETASHMNSYAEDCLISKIGEIVALIKEVITIKTRGSAVTLNWSTEVEEECVQFFSPANVRKYLNFYWYIWHPNVNIVHYPTFDLTKTKPILVAAMVLIGASVSPNSIDGLNAKTWFNSIEEAVFLDEYFVNDLLGLAHSSTLTRPLMIQALQAAYMVVLYQNWEGTNASKSRVRRYRYSTLISAARDLNIGMACHSNYPSKSRDVFDWMEFVAKEELIRTFLWIFLLDTGFVIFNNLPPRMVVREMRMHFAMPEACFQASTADECFKQLQMWTPRESPYWQSTFASTFKSLCTENYVSRIDVSVGPLNLFALASAIHSILFQCQNFFVSDQPLPPIENALTNWREEWQRYSTWFSGSPPHVMVTKENIPPELQWKRNGFYGYAYEFWLLASLKYNRIVGRCGFTDMSLDPVLDHVDQTSMRQVNDLISGFQNIEL